MSALYFDTSVIVAYYLPEKSSSAAETLMRKAKARVLSDLTEVEVTSAFTRKIRDGNLTIQSSRQAYEQFQRHLAGGYYRMVSLERRHYQTAARLILQSAGQIPLRTLDALHAAVASLEGIGLCTADETLAKAGKAFGLNVLFVRS